MRVVIKLLVIFVVGVRVSVSCIFCIVGDVLVLFCEIGRLWYCR